VLTEATADFTWALILACARRLGEGERLVRAGRVERLDPDAPARRRAGRRARSASSASGGSAAPSPAAPQALRDGG
jgi:lactate dehydrogenase-like 2-hydroxyacid dehydrogenase